MSKKYHYVVICHSDGTYITIRNILRKMNVWGGNESIYYSYSMMLPLNYCFQRDVMVFLLLRILVEWLNSADRPNESRGYMYTADCTCHHLTKNVYFLSEIWNLNKLRTEKFANVAPFVCLNAVFLSWAKNTTTWLYVTLTGHIAIRNILEKMNAWGANQSIYYSYSMMLPLNYCFQPDVMVFLLQRILVERVNLADLMNLVVTFTADYTCHHLTKNCIFLARNMKFKTN